MEIKTFGFLLKLLYLTILHFSGVPLYELLACCRIILLNYGHIRTLTRKFIDSIHKKTGLLIEFSELYVLSLFQINNTVARKCIGLQLIGILYSHHRQ